MKLPPIKTATSTTTASTDYEFEITGSDGSLADGEVFVITVNNVNRAPVVDAISNETISENTAITTINTADGGDDDDIDNETLTYACEYDLTVDGSISGGQPCTNLGATFSTSTGILDWTK